MFSGEAYVNALRLIGVFWFLPKYTQKKKEGRRGNHKVVVLVCSAAESSLLLGAVSNKSVIVEVATLRRL